MIKYVILLSSILGFLSCTNREVEEKTSPQGRDAYELSRLQDPATGRIPEGMRMRELAFASTLPKASLSSSRQSLQTFTPIGPYNVGGRTRMVAYDQSNPDIIHAGAVSGGMWRSTDAGQSWIRTTSMDQHAAVSCLVQDTRAGKENVWFYGSGEYRGNSASKSFSADYRGTGVYSSQDSGKTWTQIPSTVTQPQVSNAWSYVHRLVIDPSRTDSTILLAATHFGIYYSNDSGSSWKGSLTPSTGASTWSEIVVTSSGVFYAALESSSGARRGFYRSENGLNWTSITPTGFPSVHNRTVLAIAPSNQNIVYLLSETPGNGTIDEPGSGDPEFTSLWKYTYTSGDGSGNGGTWEDRSAGLPSGNFRSTYTSFDGYCTDIAVKPDNPDIVFIGGSSMFRSTNGFASRNQTAQIGGYDAQGYSNFNWLRDNHHPDLHWITFHPDNPDYLLCSTDGGMHFTQDCEAFRVEWESYNNGFISGQFYAVSVDKWSENTVVTGGLQDNGTFYTNQLNNTTNWENIRGSDGAYTAISDNGRVHYVSTQFANIQRRIVNSNGDVLNQFSVMPNGLSNYLFVHPFTLDPADSNTMYLPNNNAVYVNDDLAASETGVRPWVQVATMPSSNDITAIGASKTPRGTVYVGTRNQRVYKMENAHLGNQTPIDVTNNISSGSYTSCIAIDERNADEVITIYSNYNVISAWYSKDGGQTWEDIEGNLKGNSAPGTPPQFAHISDGPSFRWLEIIPITDTSEVYLLGTSIGLFATDELKGDSTNWVQQGDQVIGNVVVDMLDFRASDGFTVVGTHGNGVFSTYFENDYDITSDNLISADEDINLSIYPNPATEVLNISFELRNGEIVKASIYDVNGRLAKQAKKNSLASGSITLTEEISELQKGLYFVHLKGESFNITKPFMVK